MGRKINALCLVCIMLAALWQPSSVEVYAATDIPLTMEMITEPQMKEYCVGDLFNARGMSLLVNYSSGGTKTVNAGNENLRFEYDFSQPGDCTVKVSYSENDTAISTNYSVKVYQKPVLQAEGISVTKGRIFHIPVELSGNCGVMGIQLQVDYDVDCFIPLSVGNSGILNAELVNDSVSTSEAGSYKIIWAGSENNAESGALFDLEFLCREDVEKEIGNIEISSVGSGTYNEGYNTITFDKASIAVSIKNSGDSAKERLDNLAVFMEDAEEGRTLADPVITGNSGQGTVTVLYCDQPDGTYLTTVPDKAGTYYLKIVVEETAQYQGGSAICSFKIRKKEAAGTGTTEASGTGTTEAAGTSTTEASGTGTTEAAGTGTTEAAGTGTTEAAGTGTTETAGAGTTEAAGTGTTEAAGTGTTEAAGAGTTEAAGAGTTEAAGSGTTETATPGTTQEVKTKKMPIEFTVSMAGWESGSRPAEPVVLGNPENGKVTFTYADQSSGEYRSTVPTEPGTYFVKAVVEETENYYSGMAIGSFTITEPKSGDGSTGTQQQSGQPGQQTGQQPAQQPDQQTGQQPTQQQGQQTGQQSTQQQIQQPVQQIIPAVAKVGGLKVTARKKGLTVKWNALSGVNGYEVQLSTKKSFKNVTTYQVKVSRKSLNVKKLKKKKKYYLRIRAYRSYVDSNGVSNMMYGKWVTASKKTK